METYMDKATSTFRVTPSNAKTLNFYNLCRMCDITGYATPHRAIEATGEEWDVLVDDCGNILARGAVKVK